MQIKGIAMATSHGSPPPGTCHTEFSVENQYTYLDIQPHHYTMDQEADERGQTKGKVTKLGKEKPRGQWHNYACLRQSSAGQQQSSQLTLINDNLIKKAAVVHFRHQRTQAMTMTTPRNTSSFKKINLCFTLKFPKCLGLFSRAIGLGTCSS